MKQENIKLATQLHVGKELNLSQIKSVTNPLNALGRPGDMAKPYGGVWTSTYIDDEDGSAFYSSFKTGGDWYILDPLEADIFVVKNEDDIEFLLSNYGRKNSRDLVTFIDFEKLSKEYDALHLTSGCFEDDSLVKELDLYKDLYGRTLNIHNTTHHPFHQWLAESTLWFNKKLQVRKIIPR
ncbi:hypothetical protein [Bacillus paramycoides]|uniref:hypothetical protein n=1 Tax=Bacillus paramycoides TaxID=2026194 RepID=UPI002E1AA1D8|nr:hypothetical protein [Bacillus paramycoides]